MLSRILAGLFTTVLVQGAAPTLADRQWLEENRAAAFEVLMPTQQEHETIATYRSFRDSYPEIDERYFSIRRAKGDSSDNLIAMVVIPAGASIQRQLLDLHMRNRYADL